jgi:hypothetical protein
VAGSSVKSAGHLDHALRESGAALDDVIRTGVMLVDIALWRDAAAPAARKP